MGLAMTPPASQSAPSPIRALGEREFVLLMAFLQALQAFSIDAMLPALGTMSDQLGVASANHRQLVVGVFLFCAGLGALIPGALADRYGRRRVLFTCLSLFVVLSLACALVQDFTTLLVLRGMAGFVSAGLAVLPPAIIRDRLEGDAMARLQSLISMIFMLVPMLAPSLGQLILSLAGWRWIFGSMALMGVIAAAWAWFRLEETLLPENRQSLRLGSVIGSMRDAVLTRSAFGYVLGSALITGGLFGFINSSQQLIAEHFAMGAMFPLVFGAMALTMSTANLINARVVMRFGARRISHAALIGYILMALMQVILASQPGQTIWQFGIVMALTMWLMGFLGGNFSSIALQPFARTAGTAASTHSFVRMLLGSVIGASVGQLYDGSARPIGLALMTAGALTLALVLFSEKGRLFRRLNPPS